MDDSKYVGYYCAQNLFFITALTRGQIYFLLRAISFPSAFDPPRPLEYGSHKKKIDARLKASLAQAIPSFIALFHIMVHFKICSLKNLFSAHVVQVKN